jgi:predicted nucleotide-binding protein (sugar kinase/HSP70/actin superfamily)
MATMHKNGTNGHKKLPILGDLDVEAELQKFEEAERKRLGLDEKTDQWVEDMVGLVFTKSEKSKVTLLVGGLTVAHDYFVEAGLKGIGYNVQMLECPTNEGLRYGKEFGNRGQCNPTYFTVGNLLKFLCELRDKHGMSTKDIIDKYVFVTAGACGPCRFGMYVTEYRKALRDAGFDGFRVMLFQQTGGMAQATGEGSGLEINADFFWALMKAFLCGDVLNAMGYRLRPYEVNPGDTDRAIEQCKKIIYEALEKRTNILLAMRRCKPILANVKIDRTIVKPKVSIIGEFWAMTTEGDGNYQLQRFLESEGAECDIQLVTAWLLYMLWEGRYDTGERENLRGADKAMYGLADFGEWGIVKRKATLFVADKIVRGSFQVLAHVAGMVGYHLPDMFEVAKVSHEYYNNDLRGGEGHMEVGKLILNVIHNKTHMTLSVKPFGCMPSAGVSDGVQSAITEKYPGTIFCPVETSGDGRVNFYSRVQMYLFKAKQAALAEYERALGEHGVTKEQVRKFLDENPRYESALHKAPHAYAGSSADLVAEIAPLITKTRWERVKDRVQKLGMRSRDVAKATPHMVVELVQSAVKEAPTFVARVKEDVALLRETRQKKKAQKRDSSRDVAAAAE